ncbi:MAG: autotransporter outer membrane beta-barrel domain-containing protein, partial [Alphaproteobacteria bacterium]|nr:autotransporter outer membrane beta-barrel domain-containing protein [Alphaproteobacteria bacterium]
TAEAVHGAVRTGSGRGNRFGGGFGGQSSFAYGADAPGFEATGPRGWVSGFGGYQSQGASGNVTGGTQAYGGLVSGGGFASDERLYGVFAGGAYTQQETEYDTQEIDAASVFGGAYAGTRAGAYWVRGGLMGGYTEFSSDRTVANNTVAGGLQTASADYGATFISPSVTVGRGIGERTEVSLGGHYAALFVDGYSESGSAADLTVASRTVQVAAMRAKASYLAHQKQTQSGQISVETWAGADGVFNLGDDVDASVAAGAFETFSASFFDTAVMGFAGLGVNHRSANGKWSLNASVEGRYGTNDYWDVKGTATAQAAF